MAGESKYWHRGLPLQALTSGADTKYWLWGLPSRVIFAAALTVTGGAGIASAEAFGADGVVAGPITGASGIPSAEAFGVTDGRVGLGIDGPAGIPSDETFGVTDGQVNLTILGTAGLTSEEAFGITDGDVSSPIAGDLGITSEEAFGTDGIVAGPILGVSGITSEEAFGSTDATVFGDITGASGITSEETFGADGIVAGSVAGASGIPSAEAFGTTGFVVYPQTITGSGIASEEAFGSTGGSVSNVILGVSGIPSAEAFGVTDGAIVNIVGGIAGIPSEEAFGTTGFVLTPYTSGSRFKIFVGGSPVGIIHPGTIRVSRQLNFSATGGFTLWDEDGTSLPEIDQEIIFFYWTGTAWEKYFAGSVDMTTLSKLAKTSEAGTRWWDVSAVDYGKALSRRVVSKKYPAATYGTINSILADIATTYLVPEGINAVLGTDPGIDVPDIEFSYTPVDQVLNRLGEMSNQNWAVDWDKNLYLGPNPTANTTAPFNITDSSENGRDFRITRSRGLYRNREILKATIAQTTTTVTKSYVLPISQSPAVGDPYYVQANGIILFDSEWNGRVAHILDIQVNDVSIPFEEYGASFSNSSKMGQFVSKSIYLGWNQLDFPVFPVSGDTITLTFTINNDLPSQIVVQNDAAIAARKLVAGGTGIVEDVFEVQDITDAVTLTILAEQLLERFGVMGLEVTYETDEFGLECGQQQDVTLANMGLLTPESLNVESLQSAELANLLLRTQVKVSNAIQQRDAMSAINRLIRKLKNSSQPVNWQMIFTLAETIIGITNPGLSTGTNMLPEWVLVKPFTLSEVHVNFKVPPTGASIIIDIMADGVSIFQAPVEYTTAGGIQTFSLFRDPPLTLPKGAIVTVDVIQVGSDEPGEDGTVTMLGIVGQ